MSYKDDLDRYLLIARRELNLASYGTAMFNAVLAADRLKLVKPLKREVAAVKEVILEAQAGLMNDLTRLVR